MLKMQRILINSLIFFICVVVSATVYGCKYEEWDHSVCRYGHLPDKPEPLLPEEKQQILRIHNDRRRNARLRGSTAANMMKMEWDEELEVIAKAWAKRCIYQHDGVRTHSKYGIKAGQNIARASSKELLMESWVRWWDNEEQYFQWDGRNGRALHLTQMATWDAVRLGCARCENGNFLLICNYINSNHVAGNPYTKGPKGSMCPRFNDDGLCDCGAKFCANGGMMDLSQCQCQCLPGFTGNECTEIVCEGLICQNGGTLDERSCRCNCLEGFSGDQCTVVAPGETRRLCIIEGMSFLGGTEPEFYLNSRHYTCNCFLSGGYSCSWTSSK